MNLINLLQSMYDNLDNKWNFQPELLLEFNIDIDWNEVKYRKIYNEIIKPGITISIYDFGTYIRVIIDYETIGQQNNLNFISPNPLSTLFKNQFYEITIGHYITYNKISFDVEILKYQKKYHYFLFIERITTKEINIDLMNQLAYSWEEYILSLDRILTSEEITERIQKELNILNKT